MLTAAGTYLTNKPSGTNEAFLIVALVLFALAAIGTLAPPWRQLFWGAFGIFCIGMCFFVLAFLIKG